MKILIVEDDPVSIRLLESFLTKWGHDVQLAVNGREACEILQNPDAPNLVISDWMMPEMDGLELCRRIRVTGKSGYIYFIILTAKEENGRYCERPGGRGRRLPDQTGCLPKRLLVRVNRLLNK